ncbi:ceramide synthase 3 isoform X2 [Eublepharis macularius]|uniref:Ceramide synthase 3 isoform X2 n=1 Tax=Eublepharis macularius TaxID=481883 RepID=A0AA97KML6_EUBMA|nr:ceramide synthase 3 isoform X2 [Eublepharis macularius]
MAHILKTLNNWFWWEDIWMPENCSWANFEDRDGMVFPKPHHLYATIPFAFVMLLIRFFVERCIAVPLANALGIKQAKRVKPQPNPTLEEYFKQCTKKPSQLEMRKLAKKCNWTVHLVEKWFRRRRNLEIPTVLKKHQEACWRFIFYFLSTVGGFAVLYDKPWFHDIWNAWVGYPFQSLLPSQYWYYMAEMSFYWSLLFTLGMDTKRKDFKAHVIHHLAALGLMFFSYCANYLRLGTLVMIVHDCADFWLEAAKIFNYARWENTCSVIFVIFSVVFFTSRLIIFPFWIIRASAYYPTYYSMKFVAAYFLFNGQLLVLQCLHIYWSYLVFKILRKFIFIKKVKDDRSDEEEEEEDSLSEAEGQSIKNGTKNGCGANHPLLNNNNY